MNDRSRDHRSTRDRIRQELQHRILRGELPPGQRLTQIDLASEFGVAQTVVREALLELRFCGLVRIVDNVGVFVRELSAATLLEAYQIREMFEGLAARLACETASRRDLAELRDLADRIHQCGQAGDLDEMGRLDREFHQRTIAISGNQLMGRLTEGYRLLGMIVRAERDFDVVREEHLGIADAIAEGDADEAERRARRHVEAARGALRRMVDQDRFEPSWVVSRAPSTDRTPVKTKES